MKSLLFALVLLLWAGAASARTPFQARCEESMIKSGAVLSARNSGYRIDHTLSFQSLGQMKRTGQANSYVLGLTRAESRLSLSAAGPVLQDPQSGYECVAPQVEVGLFYPPIVIYISREFPPGSCAYREIVAHELRHFNAYLDHLAKVETTVRAALQRRFEARPLYARAGQARALLQREMDTGWMPFIKAELSKVERVQAAIDSPQEYARLSKVCQGEVQSLIRLAKRSRA